MNAIFDFPIWEDCPYREIIPSQYTIRKGTEYLIISFESDEIIKNVTMRNESVNSDSVRVMVANLGSAVFEHRHPGEYLAMIRRRIQDVSLLEEYRVLTNNYGS
jgi:hypothetical protein